MSEKKVCPCCFQQKRLDNAVPGSDLILFRFLERTSCQ